MKIVITESQYNTIVKREFDEIVTRKKEPYSWGASHYIFKTKDPNKLIKIGTNMVVDEWYDLFNSRPDLFVKVYKKGFTKITNKIGKVYDAKYVMVEKVDTKKFKSLWFELSKVVERYQESIGEPEPKSLQHYLSMAEDNLDFLIEVGKSIKSNHYLHEMFIQLLRLVIQIEELKPDADIHSDQFGIDSAGKIKCLDI